MRPRSNTLPLLVLAAALGFAAPARAQEDAGTRSIFASPAGARGIALGGAFVAVPGDPAIAAWNPAGLGFVSRLEAQASTASYDLGFREDLATVVLPSWRFGTASLTVRRFGTDGIEARDARNVILPGSFGSSESEISIGYGRTLGTALAVGGALKLQRQSVGDQSGSGVGADLGVTAYPLVLLGSSLPWATRASWGISIRNAIPPAIRLDQETVTDPGLWRTGFAYRTLFGLATLDMEKGSGSATRLHAGAEITPRPFLSLRGGFSDASLAAGAGFRVGRMTVDYAFENTAYAPVHRVGISYAFGLTVAERRDAAERQDEARLQARLADAFQRVEQERVQGLLARAEESRARGDFSQALEALGTISTLEPGSAEASDLEVRVLREHGAALEQSGDFAGASVAYGRILEKRPQDPDATLAQGRCRAESDRRAARSAEIRKAFASAMDDFAAEELVAARTGFAKILQTAPNDEDARAMLERTRTALSRRAQNLVRDARRNLSARQVDAAEGLAEQARTLDPDAEGLDALSDAIDRARAAATPHEARAAEPRPAPAPAAPASPLKERELRELYRSGLAAVEARRSADAIRYFEIVWSADPKYQRVAEYLKREYLLLGLDVYSSGRLDEAVSWWEKALDVDPTDAKARGYLTRAQQQLERSREVMGDSR
jgi:tetratricopeptide (TPR) repeat protein